MPNTAASWLPPDRRCEAGILGRPAVQPAGAAGGGCELGRSPGVLRMGRWPAADGSGVGIRLPSGHDDGVQLWGRPGAAGRVRLVRRTTAAVRRSRWEPRSRILGACTTCTGTSGNGARTCGTATTTVPRAMVVRGLAKAHTASTVAAAGASAPASAAVRAASLGAGHRDERPGLPAGSCRQGQRGLRSVLLSSASRR